MVCLNCGKEIDDESKFCKFCGSPVEKKEVEENNQRKTVYAGKIYKCPNCGETLKSFEINCPACGYEFKDTTNSMSLHEFMEKLQKIETERLENGKGLNGVISRGQIKEAIDKKLITFIRSFPIPNNKEDLIEFMVLAYSNINEEDTSETVELSKAWKAKVKQAYQKASISFGDMPEFKKVQDIYDRTNKLEDEKSKKEKKDAMLGFMILGGIAVLGLIVISVNNLIMGNFNKKENVVQQIDSKNISDSQEIVENKDVINEDKKDDITNNSFNDVTNTITSNANNFLDNKTDYAEKLQVKQFTFKDSRSHTMFVIDNPTEYNLSVKIELKLYDKDGKIIGVKDRIIHAVESKTTTFTSIGTEDYDKVEYKISAFEDDFECITSSLSYESSRSKNKEIVSLTNNGTKSAMGVEGNAIFFKNNEIVGYSWKDFDNGFDNTIKPNETITKELECDVDYDSVQFYFVGWGVK